MTHVDTDRILDKCHCGAVAGFETLGGHVNDATCIRARCTECCEQTNWFPTADGASFDWNLARRAEKERVTP